MTHIALDGEQQQTEELIEQATVEAESRLAELDDEEDPRIGAEPDAPPSMSEQMAEG